MILYFSLFSNNYLIYFNIKIVLNQILKNLKYHQNYSHVTV